MPEKAVGEAYSRINQLIRYRELNFLFLLFSFENLIAFLGYQHSPKWLQINKDNIKNKGVIKITKNRNSLLNKNKKIVQRGYSTKSKINSSAAVSLQPQSNIKKNSPCSIFIKKKRLEIIFNELGLNFVYAYENLNLEHTRKKILNDTRGLSGVYIIINKTTKDYYIGSASTNKFYARFSNHVIYLTGSKIVKLAIKKYDLKNFAFAILELYPNVVTKENNKELLDLEDKYLKLLLPNYNILTEAGSSFGYKHTEIDRQKMTDIYSDARREKIGCLNRGQTLSPETIEKMRAKALTRLPMLEETKKKCITNTRPVVLYNLNRTLYGKYSTILDAANAINCDEKTIRRALQTEKKLVKRQ